MNAQSANPNLPRTLRKICNSNNKSLKAVVENLQMLYRQSSSLDHLTFLDQCHQLTINFMHLAQDSEKQKFDLLLKNTQIAYSIRNQKMMLYHFKLVEMISSNNCNFSNLTSTMELLHNNFLQEHKKQLIPSEYKIRIVDINNKSGILKKLIEKISVMVISFFSSKTNLLCEDLFLHFYIESFYNSFKILSTTVAHYFKYRYEVNKNNKNVLKGSNTDINKMIHALLTRQRQVEQLMMTSNTQIIKKVDYEYNIINALEYYLQLINNDPNLLFRMIEMEIHILIFQYVEQNSSDKHRWIISIFNALLLTKNIKLLEHPHIQKILSFDHPDLNANSSTRQICVFFGTLFFEISRWSYKFSNSVKLKDDYINLYNYCEKNIKYINHKQFQVTINRLSILFAQIKNEQMSQILNYTYIINLIKNNCPEAEDMLNKWFWICQIQNLIIDKFRDVYFLSYIKNLFVINVVCLIKSCEKIQNRTSLLNLQKFMHQFASVELKSLEMQNQLSICQNKLLGLLGHILIGKYSQIGFRAMNVLVKSKIFFRSLVQFQNNYLFFRQINIKLMAVQQNKKTNNDRKFIFPAQVIKKMIIATFQVLSEQLCKRIMANKRNWIAYIVEAFFYIYHYLDSQSLVEIFQAILNSMNLIPSLNQQIGIIMQSLMFELVTKFNGKNSFRFFENSIQIYKQINKYEALQNSIKIRFVDFIFNLKYQINNLFLKNLNRNQTNVITLKQFYQNVQALELYILGENCSKYIQNVEQQIFQSQNCPFAKFSCVWLKRLYYVVHELNQQFILKQMVQSPVVIQQNQQQNLNDVKEIDFFHFEQQLENSATILHKIKTICKKYAILFNKLYYHNKTVVSSISNFKIFRLTQLAMVELELIYLSDLINIVSLCDIKNLQHKLMQFRLSTLKMMNLQNSQFLLELAKYYFLQMLTPAQKNQIRPIIINQIEVNQTGNRCISILKLIMNHKIDTIKFQQLNTRIFKIIYLMNQESYIYHESYRDLVFQLANYTFDKPIYLSPDRFTKLGWIIKPIRFDSYEFVSKNIFDQQKLRAQDNWISQRMLVLFLKKNIEEAVKVNQYSKFKSFLLFANIMFIRSGFLIQLQTPLKILSKKNRQLNIVQIIDSFRQIIHDEYDRKTYKIIDVIVCSRRRSLSMGINFKKICQNINTTFQSCGVFGQILTSIFVHTIANQLSTLEHQVHAEKLGMKIYQNNSIVFPRIPSLKIKNKQNWINEIINFLDQNFQKLREFVMRQYDTALVFKSYLGYLVDELIKKSQFLTAEQNNCLDSWIQKIAILFQDHNYDWKMVKQNIVTVKINDSFHEIIKSVSKIHSQFSSYFHNKQFLIDKIHRLKSCRYATNLIFPFGSYIYNISMRDHLLVTYSNLKDFQDYVITINKILTHNYQILKSKTLNFEAFWKKRASLDRQIGKMGECINLGIFDSSVNLPKTNNPNKQIEYLYSIDKRLVKFLFNESPQLIEHLTIFCKRQKINTINTNTLYDMIKRINESNKNLMYEYKDNLLIYVHYKYMTFPFEILAEIKKYQGIYRIPSVTYMLRYQCRQNIFNLNYTKYLVNSLNNLPLTEAKFLKIRQKFENYWSGVIGRAPSIQQFYQLFSKDIYLYMGHGTGFWHLSQKQFEKPETNCLMFIFGCSSAQMIFQNSQPHGISLKFLMNGCPAYLGCLWQITDIDIDKMTEEIFKSQKLINLSTAVQKAKNHCKLPYLNGSSMIIHGLPCYIVKE